MNDENRDSISTFDWFDSEGRDECGFNENDEEERLREKINLEDEIHDQYDEHTNNLEDEEKFCLYVGQEFESEKEAYDYYNRYARYLGFSVRKSSTYRSRSKSNILLARSFCCSLEGKRNTQENDSGEKRKSRGDTRTGCKASMTIRKKEDKWQVTQVNKDHNHIMVTPSKRHKLRSHRKITKGQGQVIDSMNYAGVKTNLLVSFMAHEAGGIRNIGFTKRDVYNYLSTKRQKELEKGDAATLLDYFERQQMENPSFFYSIQVDSEGHLTNFFWADARSRIDYHHFGDVVCFDPTYGTNKYGMPFVPIVGVNHHFQTVLFGGALLYSETEEAFAWVMKTWMRAMGDKKPKVILTDQDSAIGGAIKTELTGTRHRYCVWHIGRNALKNLPHTVNGNKHFVRDFSNCLYGNETVEEFESNWEFILHEYNLRENKWMKSLYEKREKWASVYTRDIFCADMYTTQRSESINSYFKDYLRSKMSLNDFMKNYDRAVMDRREKENDEDFESNYSNPILKFSTNLEKDAATYYTRSVFKMFQGQLVQSISYHHRKVDESGSKLVYHVWREEHEQSVRTVTFDSSNVHVSCSCQLFEFAGCLCRHVLKIFLVENVNKLPRDYVLKRWSKDAKYGSVVCVNGESMRADCQESLTVRYSTLCKEAINIATVGSTSPEVYKVALRTLNNSLKVVEAALKRVTISSNDSNKNVEANEMPESSSIRTGNRELLLDPPIVKHRGRPKRLSWIDKKPRSNTIPKTKISKNPKDLSSSNILVGTSSKMRYDPAQRKKIGQGMQGVVLHRENNFNQSHEKLVIDLNESIWDSSVMHM